MKARIPFPAKLPKFPQELKEKVPEIHSKEQKFFIRFWGDYLREFLNDDITTSDYTNFALTIVTTYPKLKGGNGSCVSLS